MSEEKQRPSLEGNKWWIVSEDCDDDHSALIKGRRETTLQDIVEFNVKGGNDRRFRSLEECESQLSLIQEEFEELEEAYDAGDITEVIKECADGIVVLAGLIHMLGYDPVTVMEAVNQSNLSKFVDPHNDEEVEASIRMYEDSDRYEEVYVDEKGVVRGVVVATGQPKILKGVNYREPDWTILGVDRGDTQV